MPSVRLNAYRVYFEPETYHVVCARNAAQAVQRGRTSYRAFHLGLKPGKPVKVERLCRGATVRAIKSYQRMTR